MPHIDRFGANDTPPEVMDRMYALLRKKTPEQRLHMVFDRMDFMRNLREATKHLRKAADDESR